MSALVKFEKLNKRQTGNKRYEDRGDIDGKSCASEKGEIG